MRAGWGVLSRCRVHLALTVTLRPQDGRTSHQERQRQGGGSSQVGQLQGDALRIQVAGLLPHAEDDAGDRPASAVVVAAVETWNIGLSSLIVRLLKKENNPLCVAFPQKSRPSIAKSQPTISRLIDSFLSLFTCKKKKKSKTTLCVAFHRKSLPSIAKSQPTISRRYLTDLFL